MSYTLHLKHHLSPYLVSILDTAASHYCLKQFRKPIKISISTLLWHNSNITINDNHYFLFLEFRLMYMCVVKQSCKM